MKDKLKKVTLGLSLLQNNFPLCFGGIKVRIPNIYIYFYFLLRMANILLKLLLHQIKLRHF